jgi:type II secretory pathway component PulL
MVFLNLNTTDFKIKRRQHTNWLFALLASRPFELFFLMISLKSLQVYQLVKFASIRRFEQLNHTAPCEILLGAASHVCLVLP